MRNENQKKRHSQVWLYFMYYWMIFGVFVYLGQFLPIEWRKPLSIGLLVLILITMVVQRARFSGIIMSHIYTIISGLLSYATLMYTIEDLGSNLLIQNVIIAVLGFIVFGFIGYFFIKDASNMGKYLFVTFIVLIVMSIISWFIHSPMLHTVIAIVGVLLFLLYTLYDFNRLKRGQFSPREMGFNLFLNLFRIIRYVLKLARMVKR
ncbi:Bax inhibitor-1 family protein [Staphylococcus felis]|uniref:Bax inhibitor-1/YccA family protein n=1 Tax=Staphylococcus felis TaxID=46127 RepID=UPI0025A458C4|nr:Bax inhibitor-1 family protein [Staphylococcus felis]MDM8327012.1 Bax inhibitor-1 family protein [Staphylococcus felis]